MKNSKKIIITSVLFSILGILLISTGLFFQFNKKETINIDSQEVLTSIDIDKLFSIFLSKTSPVNQNIDIQEIIEESIYGIDIMEDPKYSYFDTYFYSNFDFSNKYISIDGDRHYFAKYGDYVKFVSSKLGDEATKELNSGYTFEELTEGKELTYNELTDDLKCNDLDNDNCYILFTPIVLPKSYVKFSSLEASKNTIKGTASRTLANEVITANFELKFKENNDTYYATSLIITSIN